MNWTVVIVVSAIVGVLGTVAAILWWRLANTKAPYRDDRGGAGRDESVVIRDE